MRLSTITISGFKSFAKKTVIDVNKDITGIVGPNGSGKSNIAEAIRFVLGEQSMKSMRTSLSSDLIFKGSASLPALSRASVALTLTQTKQDNFREASERIAPFLAYDEIVLSRELFSDGSSDYTINGAKVRLKDVTEILALAGIGNNKHTILNQGEADRVLLLSPQERKTLLEDALGLKVYQLRIDESKKRLEKTHKHLEEVRGLEREIKPHFHFLERQLEKIKKYEIEKETFRKYAQTFFAHEEKRLHDIERDLQEIGSSSALSLLLETVESDLSSLRKKEHEVSVSPEESEIQKYRTLAREQEHRLREKVVALELVKRDKRYLEDELTLLLEGSVISYEESQRDEFRDLLFAELRVMNTAFTKHDEELYSESENKSKIHITTFLKNNTEKEVKKENITKKIQEIEKELQKLTYENETLEAELPSYQTVLLDLMNTKDKEREKRHEQEKKLYSLKSRAEELRNTILLQKEREVAFENDKRYKEALLSEAFLFLGDEVKSYTDITLGAEAKPYNRFETLRALEKSKLKLEEGSVSSSFQIEEEYETIKARSLYLQKEINDILATEKEIELLIEEVTSHMKAEYEKGLQKVSDSFSLYFATVFPGGEAKLVTKKYENDDADTSVKEDGVDIDVKLATKKVKSLSAFSGGEKALTAIALLFALAEVTPPPFIVLDETDAPLDEHNAKRYGETLALLAKKSKLLVITHNRETMNHCEMLYGVTLGADGASKLLSVNLK